MRGFRCRSEPPIPGEVGKKVGFKAFLFKLIGYNGGPAERNASKGSKTLFNKSKVTCVGACAVMVTGHESNRASTEDSLE